MVKVTKDSLRRSLRTALAVTIAVAAAVPLLVEFGIVDPAAAPWLATIVALATGVTRLMADPRVDALIGKLLGPSWTKDGLPALPPGPDGPDVP